MTTDTEAKLMELTGRIDERTEAMQKDITEMKGNINELYEDRNKLRDEVTALHQAHNDQMNRGGCNSEDNPPLQKSLKEAILRPTLPIIVSGVIVLGILGFLYAMGLRF